MGIESAREETNYMANDNATPLRAMEYDKKINNTIPYYNEFYNQILDIVEQYNFRNLIWKKCAKKWA